MAPLGKIDDYGAALRVMVNKPFLGTRKYEEQQWRANREGAHPRLLDFEKALVKRFRELGVPLYAHCVVRTPAEQDAAYALGRTKVKGSDPYPHRFAAVDIIHGVRGWDLPKECWDLIGHVGQEIARKLSVTMTWGGDWHFYDPAHWELAFWSGMEPTPPFMHRNGRLPKGAS